MRVKRSSIHRKKSMNVAITAISALGLFSTIIAANVHIDPTYALYTDSTQIDSTIKTAIVFPKTINNLSQNIYQELVSFNSTAEQIQSNISMMQDNTIVLEEFNKLHIETDTLFESVLSHRNAIQVTFNELESYYLRTMSDKDHYAYIEPIYTQSKTGLSCLDVNLNSLKLQYLSLSPPPPAENNKDDIDEDKTKEEIIEQPVAPQTPIEPVKEEEKPNEENPEVSQ